LVSSRSLWLRIESRSSQIRREYLVTRVKKRLSRSAANLAVCTRYDYFHDFSSFTRDMANGRVTGHLAKTLAFAAPPVPCDSGCTESFITLP
jgi:hypothetical protein